MDMEDNFVSYAFAIESILRTIAKKGTLYNYSMISKYQSHKILTKLLAICENIEGTRLCLEISNLVNSMYKIVIKL